MEVKGYYSSFESFALVDGPGVRSVLFLSGCPFRCLYCHNPETWDMSNAKEISVDEAYAKLSRYAPYWKDKGGITISGGEPLLQIDFLIELFKKAKKQGYTTCIDTAGGPFTLDEPFKAKFDELLKYLDLILLDLKAPNDKLHHTITGVGNTSVINMYNYLREKNFPIWVRYVLVPNYTDDEQTLIQARDFLRQYPNIKRVEVLSYHPFAITKYQELKIPYKLEGIQMPTEESIKKANEILETSKYTGYLD